MTDQIDEETKHRRLQELMDVENEVSLSLNQAMEGKTYPIIVEGPSKQENVWYGRTSGNKMILFPYQEGVKVGDTLEAKVEVGQTWVLKGNPPFLLLCALRSIKLGGTLLLFCAAPSLLTPHSSLLTWRYMPFA